ncbi:hypothetical protein FS749_012109 [Ceratobasidium sp. UAMH 11750]|nr:hypothetical protein FS749_012109 [Ceratobasidium sp. UAMH 11750]
MDVTAVTGGLWFGAYNEDKDENKNKKALETQKADNLELPAPGTCQTPAPASKFTVGPETQNEPVPLPTVAHTPAAPAPFVFAIPPSSKPTTNLPAASLLASAPSTTSLTPPSLGLPAPSPAARPPLTFKVPQLPMRPPLAEWSPRNSPAPFQFVLPGNGTPRHASTSTPGTLAINRTPVRSVTPVLS